MKILHLSYISNKPDAMQCLISPICQEVKHASVAVVDDGKAMLVMGGGDAHHNVLSSTQLVRPGHPTQPIPTCRRNNLLQ